MKPRWILHVDLDQFLASVELERHPELVGLPVIVGGSGDPAEARKVVTCASYEAREFGVHAGMPLRAAARRCPDATFLPSDPEAYDAASEQVMGLLRDLGHPVEVWGWDEAYLGADIDDPEALAEQIRAVIAAATGLSCSVGISDNKQRAKVATGFAKPAGIYTLTESNWMTVMGDRPVDALWGVGPKTAKKLAGLDIATVWQLAHTDARAPNRAVVATAGQRRRRRHGQRGTVGAALPQPRRHVPARPHGPRRNGCSGNRIGATSTERSGGRLADRHPGCRDSPHQHVLHADEDPQTRRAHHRWQRHYRSGVAGVGSVRAGPPGATAGGAAGIADADRGTAGEGLRVLVNTTFTCRIATL
jgi:hypothetical protein